MFRVVVDRVGTDLVRPVKVDDAYKVNLPLPAISMSSAMGFIVNVSTARAGKTNPTDPSKNQEGSATRKFNPKGCATHPRRPPKTGLDRVSSCLDARQRTRWV
jgi:hypothetical protein